ncbi:hypothetical protein ACBY01_08740 [Sphingomonas sp. ac-8]|uniref:hypothetical protein n=1 Tax=Sphingomonas sp. ac-8 TaxID=3242977 RepID=UPI003A801737
MQDTQQSQQTVAGAVDQMVPVTVTHFAVIALFAVVVIVAIVWGMRLRAKRRAADRVLAESNAARPEPTHTAVADPDAPGEAVAIERRAPVEPTDIPAPAPPPVQEPRAAAVPSAPAEPTPATPPTPAAPPAPVEAPAQPAATPAPTPKAAPAANDLTTLKGLGPKAASQLAELGVTSIADMAALSPAEADRIDAALGTFQGRMGRDRWIEQAQLLAAGDRAGYEATFGKLG